MGATSLQRSDLPSYKNPPVAEVACGVLFKTVGRILAPHFGQLWERFKPDYPSCSEAPPIAPSTEQYGDKQDPEFELTPIPPLPRIWFIHSTQNGIIQVQRDRFLYNWRKIKEGDEYPRFERVFGAFQSHLETLELFLREADLGHVEPAQYDLTYINHIYKGDGWDNLGGISDILPDFSWRATKGRFLPFPSGINWGSVFDLPEEMGRLRLNIRHGLNKEDGREVLRVELKVQGFGKNESKAEMREWFNLAREWIVLGFADITHISIQKNLWGLEK